MSITLDEERTFTVFQDPVDHKYIVDEMLYDECQRCFAGWSNMSWNSVKPVRRWNLCRLLMENTKRKSLQRTLLRKKASKKSNA